MKRTTKHRPSSVGSFSSCSLDLFVHVLPPRYLCFLPGSLVPLLDFWLLRQWSSVRCWIPQPTFSTAARSGVLSLGFSVQSWVAACVLFSIDFSSHSQVSAFSAHQFSSALHRCLSSSSEQVCWLLSFLRAPVASPNWDYLLVSRVQASIFVA
jgi:hypothetical protein